MIARICQDRNIFATLAANEDATGVSSAALITASGLQPSVFESIMNYACVHIMVAEALKGRYIATKLTEGDGRSDAFKLGHKTSEDFYTWLDTHPVQKHAFHNFMKEQFTSLPTWLDVVSFGTEFARDIRPDDVVFVDVGGGNGAQCAALKKNMPNLKGQVILQDQSYVLETALEVGDLEKMPYDFFKEQPVKGMPENPEPVCNKSLNLKNYVLVSTTSARSSTTSMMMRASAF